MNKGNNPPNQANPNNEQEQAPPPTPIRTFIAIDLPMGVKAMVADIQKEMRDYMGPPAENIKWVRSGGVHLTIQFLGSVMPDNMPDIESALRRACSDTKPFSLQLGKLGAFPNMRQPRVLWLGLVSDMEGTRQLTSLQSSVVYRMTQMGFKPEKDFNPHLTLGRMREDVSRRDLDSIGTMLTDLQSRAVFEAQFPVRAISLMKSALHPGGAVYTQLAEIEFGNKG